MSNILKQTCRALIVGAVVGAVALTAPTPARALDTGAAVGIGLGSFALGTALGAASNPYGYAPSYGSAPSYGYAAPSYGYAAPSYGYAPSYSYSYEPQAQYYAPSYSYYGYR